MSMKAKKPFRKAGTGSIFKFWSISMVLDLNPDPHSQYGSRTSK